MPQHDIPTNPLKCIKQNERKPANVSFRTQIPDTHSLIIPEYKAKALKTEALWTKQISHICDEQEESIDGCRRILLPKKRPLLNIVQPEQY